METVTGTYSDYSKHNNIGHFKLVSDQAMIYFSWKPPTHWSGTVGGVKVSFVQTSASGHSEMDYDFSDFPKEVEDAIPSIIQAIDEKMKKMD